MSKAYSNDLRERVIKNYEEGMPKEKLVEVFKIGISTLNRWIRNYLMICAERHRHFLDEMARCKPVNNQQSIQ